MGVDNLPPSPRVGRPPTTLPPLYLKTIRLRRRMTQAQLAAASGVQQSAISHLERTRNVSPSHRTVVALARALGVDSDRMAFGPDPHVPDPHVEDRDDENSSNNSTKKTVAASTVRASASRA